MGKLGCFTGTHTAPWDTEVSAELLLQGAQAACRSESFAHPPAIPLHIALSPLRTQKLPNSWYPILPGRQNRCYGVCVNPFFQHFSFFRAFSTASFPPPATASPQCRHLSIYLAASDRIIT